MKQQDDNHFIQFAETMPNIIWTALPDGNINYVNKEWSRFAGEVISNEWGNIGHPDDVPKVVSTWKYCREKGTMFETEARFKSCSGDYRWFLIRATPIRNSKGQVIKWIGYNTDIDDQKKIQEELERLTQYLKANQQELVEAKKQAEAANELKSSFLANMSHEIRTPLSAIMGFAHILSEQKGCTTEQKTYISRIEKNANSLICIINDILDLSKVEAGRLEIENIPFSLKQLTLDVIELFQDLADKKNIKLALAQCPVSTPEFIISDPTRLRQIMINLVGNALKFTSKGQVSILVTNKVINQKNHLSIEIKDTGIGLTQEQALRLFKPFSQADHSTTRTFGGTGLGLTLSKRLANAMGGDVSLKSSELGKGTTFEVHLAANIVTPDEIMALNSKNIIVDSRTSRGLKGRKVLIVDDSSDNIDLLKIVLEQKKMQVATAQNGREAIHKAMSEDYDIVLMDIQMPELDGIQAMEHLKTRNYKKPVIALTAHAMKEEQEKAQGAGFNDYATKPINFENLFKKMTDLLQ